MAKDAMRAKLSNARSLNEVKSILSGAEGVDCERVWGEIGKHRSIRSEKLDLNELESVSGGEDRDWITDGCAATCEDGSWCGSNDRCYVWDVTYDHFQCRCPDGQKHVIKGDYCVRCGWYVGAYDAWAK